MYALERGLSAAQGGRGLTVHPMISAVVAHAHRDRSEALKDRALADIIDPDLPIPSPFHGGGKVKIVVVGQDPTVADEARRRRIKVVLALDESGPLRRHVERICRGLGCGLEGLYATNACKWFFRQRPTDYEANVLALATPFCLDLLRNELAKFPDAKVVTLGEPVLSMLVRDPGSREVKTYWGYRRGWQSRGTNPFSRIEAANCMVGATIYPCPHQPSMHGPRTAFYRDNFERYLEFAGRVSETPMHSVVETEIP